MSPDPTTREGAFISKPRTTMLHSGVIKSRCRANSMLTALTGMADLKIGKFKIWSSDRLVTLEAETSSGLQSTGVGTLYELSGPDGLRLTVRDTRWASGERDIVACERHRSAERFDTLVERLRLAVLERGGPYVELRQARLRPNGRAGLFDADLAALTDGAGVDIAATLRAHGAQSVGTREELLGDAGRTRRRVGARVGPRGKDQLPVVAYVLTRVAPVANRVPA